MVRILILLATSATGLAFGQAREFVQAKPSREILPAWKVVRASRRLEANRMEHSLAFTTELLGRGLPVTLRDSPGAALIAYRAE